MTNNRNLAEFQRKLAMIFMIGAVFLVLIVLAFFSRLDQILYSPKITPKEWCEIQPYLELNILGYNIIIVQPSSTFFVYLLGILTVYIGLYFIRNIDNQESRLWWGVALILWGLGALFAGTSYQIFSYEIKCSGREYCLWTSWWEIVYLILSVGSVVAMMIAQSYSCITEKWRAPISIYAFLIMVSYIIIVLIGSSIPVKFMISFELMVLFLVPNILFFFFLNSWRYIKYKNRLDLVLLVIWISLGIVVGIYYLYLIAGVTERLWENGIWFSENDVLHIGLIAWMIYIRITLGRHLKDTDGKYEVMK